MGNQDSKISETGLNLPTISSGLSLTKHEQSLLKQVGQVNKLVAYQVDIGVIVDWTKDLSRLLPDLEASKLAFLMDSFKKGDLEWDKSQGIQNLFLNLKKIVKENGAYKILKPIW